MKLLPKDAELGYTPYLWLVYITPFAVGPWLGKNSSTAEVVVTFAGLAVFLFLYFRGWWAKSRERIVIIAALVALGLAFWPTNAGAGAMFIYASSFSGLIEPPKRSMRFIAAIALIVVGQAVWLEMQWFRALWPLVFVLIVGGVNLHFSQVSRSNARLRLAHDEIEHLAKSAERERIARDLHDLLGHTLSLIILKSELASKLSERDPERARSEIRDVERISRDALAQVRNAVRGYRSGGLQREVDAARTALQAANVTLQAQLAPIAFTAAQEAVLALALRESVTNVIRHAYAKNCTIALAQTPAGCTLTIADDGRGGKHAFGTGLLGMRERIEALGGTLNADGSRGTTLTIAIPLDSVLSPQSSSLRMESA